MLFASEKGIGNDWQEECVYSNIKKRTKKKVYVRIYAKVKESRRKESEEAAVVLKRER